MLFPFTDVMLLQQLGHTISLFGISFPSWAFIL